MATPAYDVFISHSNADKPGFVELLADRLRRAGVRVWYDDYVVEIGDSISEVIARGLAESRYGIVVLSRSFLRGGWSRHELRGLWQRQIHGRKTILPILHDISLDEVRACDPSLADLCALDTSRHDLNQIISTLLQLLKGEQGNGHAAPPDLLDVHNLAGLAKLGSGEVLKRLERYGTAARLTPGSGEAAMGLGLTYLYLHRFPEAIEQLGRAARLLPTSAKAYLYYALALLRARKPKGLPLAEVRQILQAVETAASLDPREGLCDVFAIILKREYFQMNGLRIPSPGFDHHLRELCTKRIDRHELAAFSKLLTLHDHSLLDALMR